MEGDLKLRKAEEVCGGGVFCQYDADYSGENGGADRGTNLQ